MNIVFRQLVLLVASIDRTVDDLSYLFRLSVCHGSRDLAQYGLPARGPMSEDGRRVLTETGVENVVLPLGTDFLELCAPTRPDTSAAKFMDRRGGDGGFMVVMQAVDVDTIRDRAKAAGIRVPLDHAWPHYRDIHLHTKDVPGAILSFAEDRPANDIEGAWYPAGTAWQTVPKLSSVSALCGLEIQVEGDVAGVAGKWASVMALPLGTGAGTATIRVDNAPVTFVPASDGRGTGIRSATLRVRDVDAILDRARARAFPIDGRAVQCGGIWFKLEG